MNCGVKRCSLTIILHEQEVIRCTTFNFLLWYGIPVIRVIVFHSRIVELLRLVDLVFNQPTSSRFERSRALVILLDLDKLTSDPLHSEIGRHPAMALTFVLAWARYNYRLLYKSLFSCSKSLCCGRPRLSAGHCRVRGRIVILRTGQILNAKDVHRALC